MAEALDLEHSAVGCEPDLPQLWEIVQASADPEVVSVIDRRLGSQCPVFLVILLDALDARVLVIDVQGWGDVMGDHPGAELPPRLASDLAIEDELHLLRAAEIEVLTDHLLEEQAAVPRAIEHLGGGELRLQDRDIVTVAGLAVRSSEGVR